MRESLPLGGHVRVMLDGGTPLVADVSQEAADALGLEPGSTIWAWIEATAIRVYR
jgi:molybdopterin-binding protein